MLIDDDYMAVGTHLDEQTKAKIELGEYVDLAKLLPRDKIKDEEDHQMEIINKGGQTFWVADKESSSINLFAK